MPIITLRLNRVLSSQEKQKIGEGLSSITKGILGKNEKLIVVRFDMAQSNGQWFNNGDMSQEDGLLFELNIVVTTGTNSQEEKARWIEAAWHQVSDCIGSSSYPNYICVTEVDGHNWGYNGLTQERRKQQLLL